MQHKGLSPEELRLRRYCSQLDENLQVCEMGRYLELYWTGNILPSDLYFTVQVKKKGENASAVIRSEVIASVKTLLAFEPNCDMIVKLGIALGPMKPPKFLPSIRCSSEFFCPVVASTSPNAVALKWEVPQFQTVEFVYSIELKTLESKSVNWRSVYTGTREACVIKNLLPNSIYVFRLLVIKTHSRTPSEGVVGITFTEVHLKDSFSRFNKSSWSSPEVAAITTPEAPNVSGISTHWICEWKAPNAHRLSFEFTRLLYELEYTWCSKGQHYTKVIETQDTTIRLTMLTADQDYGVSLRLRYGLRDAKNKERLYQTALSGHTSISTIIVKPMIQVSATEALVNWTSSVPDVALPPELSLRLQRKECVSPTWEFIDQEEALVYEFPLEKPDLIHQVRLCAVCIEPNDKATVIGTSAICYIISPITLNVHGIGTALRLSWASPSGSHLIPTNNTLRYILTEVLPRADVPPRILYEGQQPYYIPNDILRDLNYEFQLRASLDDGSRSYPSICSYSSHVSPKLTIKQITCTSCDLDCSELTSEDVAGECEFLVEARWKNQSWTEVYTGFEATWRLQSLPASSLIFLRVRLRLHFPESNGKVVSSWQIFQSLEFLTAVEELRAVASTAKSLTVGWSELNAPSDFPDPKILYSLEVFCTRTKSFVFAGNSRAQTLMKDGLKPLHYYCVRLRSNWSKSAYLGSVYSPATVMLTAPSEMEIKNKRFNHIDIAWTSLKRSELPKPVSHLISHKYKILVAEGCYGHSPKRVKAKNTHEAPAFQEVYSSANRTHFIARQFHPFTTYHIRLCVAYTRIAVNEQLLDPEHVQESSDEQPQAEVNEECLGPVFNVYTEMCPPCAPTELELAEVFLPSECLLSGLPTSFILFQWKEPRDNGKRITGYAVELASRVADETNDHGNAIWRPGKQDWAGVYVGLARKYVINMKQLHEYKSRTFCFRVQAANVLGFSEYSAVAQINYVHQIRATNPTHQLVAMEAAKCDLALESVAKSWEKSKLRNKLPSLRSIDTRIVIPEKEAPSVGQLYLTSRNFQRLNRLSRNHRGRTKPPRKPKLSHEQSFEDAAVLYKRVKKKKVAKVNKYLTLPWSPATPATKRATYEIELEQLKQASLE